jgi:Flp pilus assembly protein TadD
MEHFVKAAALHPKFPNAHFNAAVSSAKAGDHNTALEWFGKALALTPQNAMYYQHYGTSLMESKDPQSLERARDALATSVQLDANGADSYNLMGVVEVSLHSSYSLTDG